MTDGQSRLAFFRQTFGGSWITQGIWVAAELGIADLLTNGPCTAGELAEKTHTHGDALYRVHRALASVGIFAEDAHGRFSLTPLADLLRTDGSTSQRPFAIMMGAEFHRAWGELLHSVRTGEPGFEKKFGVPFFQYMTEHPDRHRIYDSAMGAFGKAESKPVLDAYDFAPFRIVVDVGGGSGLFLTAMLNQYPALHGVLFDLPAVADRARSSIWGAPEQNNGAWTAAELLDTSLSITSFGEDDAGEIYVAHYAPTDGAIYRIVQAGDAASPTAGGGGGGGGGCFIETAGQGTGYRVGKVLLLGVLTAAFVVVIRVRSAG